MSFGPDRCPNCEAPKTEGAADCPSCGVVFAKWRPPEERRSAVARAVADAPASEVAARRPSAVPLSVKAGLAALCLGAWAAAYRPSLPQSPPPGAAVDPANRFFLRGPEGWEASTPTGCGPLEVCWGALFRAPPGGMGETGATLRLGFLPYGGKITWTPESLAEALAGEAVPGGTRLEPAKSPARLNGLEGTLLDYSASFKREVETQPEIVVSEAEALRQLKEKNPNALYFSVKRKLDHRRPDGLGGVVMQERVTTMVESRVEGGVIAVPARGGHLVADFQYDSVNASSRRDEIDRALRGLTVLARPRPADGPWKLPILSLLGGFTAWVLKRLRA